MTAAAFPPGAIVNARGRDWIVLPGGTDLTLCVRPLAGREDEQTVLVPQLEAIASSTFALPDPAMAGSCQSLRMLRDAMTLKLRAGAGPFRCFGSINLEPRVYQLVPLMMALRQPTVRLLIADDVGVGKTVEALLIARELWDRTEVKGMTVLCPAHLCEQWQREMVERFNLPATIVHPRNIRALERTLSHTGHSVFEEYPITIVSLDYIKSQIRRDDFLRACPGLVIVDEVHGCTLRSGSVQRQQRYELLKELAADPNRHLLMLSATPHSGDVVGFHNLLALLDPEFANLTSTDKDVVKALRARLGQHFIQRRRMDIEQWIKHDTQFPERLYADAPYRYTQKMTEAMSLALKAAAEAVRAGESVHYWSALGMLRSIASSPAAGIQSLQTRIDNEAAQADLLMAQVLDGDDDQVSTADGAVEATRRWDPQGKLLNQLEKLSGPKTDQKLAHLIEVVRQLLAEGLRPVVFCRFIATADYLEQHLRAELSRTNVRSVSGRFGPEERMEVVRELSGDATTPYVLVTTDCLSEGVNLQGAFSAVVHYDLSWNPTQHEQREGRVDRFGQPLPQVKAVMIYSPDSAVDVAVLRNITAKARRIKRDLGIAVPLPDDETTVAKAVMTDVLAAAQGQVQLGFDFDIEEAAQAPTSLQWQHALEREKKSRTLFAQEALRPEEVLPEWHKTRQALGDAEQVERFIKRCWQGLGVQFETRPNGRYRVDWNTLPEAHRGLADALTDVSQPLHAEVVFKGDPPPGALALNRSHPMVVAAAEYMAELALNHEDPGAIARCAVARVPVDKKRTILLLRLRHELSIKDAETQQEKNLLAEELLAVELTPDALVPLDSAELDQLLAQDAVGNLAPAAISRALNSVIKEVDARRDNLNTLAHMRAETLLQDHTRIRQATRRRFRAAGSERTHKVRALLPVDVIGVYQLLPGGMA